MLKLIIVLGQRF